MKSAATVLGALVAGTVVMAAVAPASAQFYRGKTVSVIINYDAGGNTDVAGRSIMRHMEKHIPGKPRIVIRNMPGAGGIVGANYVGEAAKRDGTVFGVFTVPALAAVMQDPALRVNFKDFTWVGAIGQQTIGHIRKDVAPGVNKPENILKVTQVFKSAGHAPNNDKDIRIRLMLGLIGIRHEHVTGYKSAGTIRRAIIQNEVQYTEDSLTGYFAGAVQTLIQPGISTPVWHLGLPTADGKLAHSPTVPKEIPTFLQVYQAKFGKDALPKGPEWETLLVIAHSRQFLRAVVLPPDAPKEAVETLRKAWDETMKDPEFVAEFHKLNNSELESLSGQAAQKAVANLVDIKPELRKFMLDYSQSK